jgi:hypothetical protein
MVYFECIGAYIQGLYNTVWVLDSGCDIQENINACACCQGDIKQGNSFHPFGCVVNDSENIVAVITLM